MESAPAPPTRVFGPLRSWSPERLVQLAFALAIVTTLVPIWTVTWLPFQDLGGHIELMDVLHRYGDPSTLYQETYTLPRALDPNTLSLWLSWALSPLMGVMGVTKLLLSFYVVGLPLAMRSIARAFGRSEWLSFLSFPLVFNALLNVGFINYLIALPLMFWMIPLAKRLAERADLRSAILLGSVSLVLFYAHVLAFVIGWAMSVFILLLFARPKVWPKTLLVSLPAVILLLIWVDRMFLDPVATEMGRTFGTEAGLGAVFHSFDQRIVDFHTWAIRIFRDSTEEVAFGVIVLFWLWALGTPTPQREGEGPDQGWRIRCQGMCLEIMTTITVMAYFALPSAANEIAVLTERLAIMIVLFLLLWPRSRMDGPRMRLALWPVAVGVIVYPFFVQAQFADFEERHVGDLPEAISSMEPKTRLAYVFRRPQVDTTYMRPLWHIPKALHALKNGGVSHDSFAFRPYTPIQYRPGKSPTRTRPGFTFSDSIYEYDYVLIQGQHAPHELFGREGVEMTYNKGGYWVFRIRDPESAAAVVESSGRGGFQDRYDCPEGAVLAGFSGQRRLSIEALTPHCRELGKKPRRPAPARGPTYGHRTQDALAFKAFCPIGEAVMGLRGLDEGVVRHFEILCRPLNSPAASGSVLKPMPSQETLNFEVLCPEGTFATGFRGRSGALLDRVGLACNPLPRTGRAP